MTEPALARDTYAKRLSERRVEAARLARIELSFGNGRLAVAIAAASIGWFAFRSGSISAWWLALPAVLFAALAVAHDRVIAERHRLERAAAFYERGLTRLDGSWAGKGPTGSRFQDEAHLYAADLDLFGRGSLFELLCSARTRAGEEKLASWLLAPAPPAVVRARQQAVDELRSRIDLREDLAILGADVEAGVEPEALRAWSAAPPILRPAPLRIVALLPAMAATITGAAWFFDITGAVPFLAALLAEAVVARSLRAGVREVLAGVDRGGRDLALLSGVLKRLEREPFSSPHLVALRSALDTEGDPPSRRIARLNRLVELLDSRRNQLFAPFAVLVIWGTQLALAIEAWRASSGGAVRRWLDAAGEMEALCDLAAFAFENPGHPFPGIVEGEARFEAERLGHPLIPAAACVRNDLRLGVERRVLIVSGSNMSGKSTLLRAAGINAVLAQAGAPVCSTSLRMSPLVVGASIRIHDSLSEGTSRFYAEITRLKRIVDLTREPAPVLFLLDEMLNGTNSHDRRIGAGAVTRALASRGAVGLITTHDLALAHISDSPDAHAANVHFEDRIEAGRITFDYVMRDGVVTRSNGLALMRAVGLDVGGEGAEA